MPKIPERPASGHILQYTSMLFWLFWPTSSVWARGSRFKPQCYDKVIFPDCMHTACNRTYFVRAAAVLTIVKSMQPLTCLQPFLEHTGKPSASSTEMVRSKLMEVRSQDLSHSRSCICWLPSCPSKATGSQPVYSHLALTRRQERLYSNTPQVVVLNNGSVSLHWWEESFSLEDGGLPTFSALFFYSFTVHGSSS